MDLKHGFIVSTACSAGAQYLQGAVYCMLAFFLYVNFSMSADVSLYIICKVGLNPRDSHHLCTFWYAPRIYVLWQDLIAIPLTKIVL